MVILSCTIFFNKRLLRGFKFADREIERVAVFLNVRGGEMNA